MPLANTREMLQKAVAEGYAVGAFNIVNELTARAVVQSCEEMRAPVILQTSTATVKHIGVRGMIGFLWSIADNATVPVSVHLDHCRDLNLCRACMDAGWPSVMIDASHLSLAENISTTREIVAYAASRGISVEGELGAINGVEEDVSASEKTTRLASLEDSVTFTAMTGIDLFAPAIGTAHGMYQGEPKLDFDRFKEIRKAVAQPLVIHGGTGLAPEVFVELVRLGASKINISTAVKIAYMDGIKQFLSENPGDSNPLHLDGYVDKRVKEMTNEHIAVFGSKDKA